MFVEMRSLDVFYSVVHNVQFFCESRNVMDNVRNRQLFFSVGGGIPAINFQKTFCHKKR